MDAVMASLYHHVHHEEGSREEMEEEEGEEEKGKGEVIKEEPETKNNQTNRQLPLQEHQEQQQEVSMIPVDLNPSPSPSLFNIPSSSPSSSSSLAVAVAVPVAPVSWADLILHPSPPLRLMLIAGVGVAVCQQINGSEALVYFSPFLLQQAGFTSRHQAFAVTSLLGVCKMLFTCVALLLVDRVGRRALVLGSVAGMAVMLVVLAVLAPMHKAAVGSAVAMCVFISVFCEWGNEGKREGRKIGMLMFL